MRVVKIVQLMSLTGIMLAAASVRTQAIEAPLDSCGICANGLGSCPADNGASLCRSIGCPDALPGCADNFGNCEFFVGCNDPM